MIRMYSVYDAVTNKYGSPQPATNDDEAKRNFIGSLIDPRVPEYILPDVYLAALGEYDDENGIFSNYERPRTICSGLDPMIARYRSSFDRKEECTNEISEEEVSQ